MHAYNYLVVPKKGKPFYDNYFDVENTWEEGMVVYDILKHMWMDDPKKGWVEIKENHL